MAYCAMQDRTVPDHVRVQNSNECAGVAPEVRKGLISRHQTLRLSGSERLPAQSYRSPYDAAVMTTMTVAMTVTMMMALVVIRADCAKGHCGTCQFQYHYSPKPQKP